MPASRTIVAAPVCLALLLAATPADAQGGSSSYQGLWWRAPGGSESGWGVNLAHQGDVLFATWFTYDSDGAGLWLVMPAGIREVAMDDDPYYGGYPMTDPATKSFAGTLYRTTGPSYDSSRFDPARVVATAVGTARFTFSGSNSGTFTYTVNGVAQSKPITRQEFASPMSRCEVGGSRGSTPNYEDLWWGAPAGAESGWGINITHQGDTLFVTWFTYGADGRGLWLAMSNGVRTGPGSYSGALYRTTGPAFSDSPWDAAKVGVSEVGRATLTFASPDSGTFAYTVNGVTQTKPIVRQVFAAPVSACES